MPRIPRKKIPRKISRTYSVKHFNATVLLWLSFVMVLEISIILGVKSYQDEKPVFRAAPVVSSFEECVGAGYPVMESYPRQCRTIDGKTFVEQIVAPTAMSDYDNATEADIVVTLPLEGAVTGKEFSIIGKAKSSWFVGGEAPFGVYGEDNKTLAKGVIRVGEVSTKDALVSFEGNVKINSSFTGPATIYLRKASKAGTPKSTSGVSIKVTVK